MAQCILANDFKILVFASSSLFLSMLSSSFSRNRWVADDRDVSFVPIEANLVTQWEMRSFSIS